MTDMSRKMTSHVTWHHTDGVSRCSSGAAPSRKLSRWSVPSSDAWNLEHCSDMLLQHVVVSSHIVTLSALGLNPPTGNLEAADRTCSTGNTADGSCTGCRGFDKRHRSQYVCQFAESICMYRFYYITTYQYESIRYRHEI